jgi:TusA-related sulfurtransferase
MMFFYEKSEWSEITVDELYDRLNSDPPLILDIRTKDIVTICPGGGLSLVAVDILVDADFKDVKSLKGGMDLWSEKGYPTTTDDEFFYPSKKDRAKIIQEQHSLYRKYRGEVDNTVDARGLSCPQPIMKSIKALKSLDMGQVLEILTTDPGSKSDIPAWARSTGQELLGFEERDTKDFRCLVKRMK